MVTITVLLSGDAPYQVTGLSTYGRLAFPFNGIMWTCLHDFSQGGEMPVKVESVLGDGDPKVLWGPRGRPDKVLRPVMLLQGPHLIG